jgi:5,5'-dehydrodivanillate O-demethylase oxygenase subunit
MLTSEQNQLLTQTGAGTPMGELLRRYWWPIAGVTEFDEQPTKPVRLMGEDLTLYKDRGGNYGLLDRHCPHRRADLTYGLVEDCGLRCSYHGWHFDAQGRCLEQPYDDIANPEANLKAQVRVKAYPVEECGGLLWAYLGPAHAPALPRWEFFFWKNGFRQIVLSELQCNWLQCQENSIDPVHTEWQHRNWQIRASGKTGPYSARHIKVGFEEFEYGFTYKRVTEGGSEADPLWTVGRVCLWPYALFTGTHVEFRVPVDDTNTLSVGWFYARVPPERQPYEQNAIPTWNGPVKDAKTARFLSSHIMNQDFIAWIGQGAVAERDKEFLGASDLGITMIRRRFLKDLETMAAGGDPKAIIRDPETARYVTLPVADREGKLDGQGRRVEPGRVPDFPFQAGMPDSVKQEFNRAMGIAKKL